jgi:site-specific recombinase XerD
MTQGLEPLEPEQGVELYLRQRQDDAADSTIRAHTYRLKHFIRWCDEEDITNLNELTGRRLYEYRLWRKEDGDLNTTSVRTQLSTLRAFVKFLETIDAVPDNLYKDISLPALKEGEGVREVMLEADRAQEILSHLSRFEYASRRHVIFAVLWKTGMRTGALHSLDVEDIDAEKQALQIRHCPETGTSLKNGNRGERMVAANRETLQLIEDWVSHTRPDTSDEYGRNPLMSTASGRISKGCIRKAVYRVTRPCAINGDCCGEKGEFPSKCESSVSPHAMRRGSITHHLKEEVPKQVVSDRTNVSPDVLDEHYNEMSHEEQMEQRRQHLNNI